MRIRLAHDGRWLYVGIEVSDDVVGEKDALTINLSKEGYRNWRGQKVGFDTSWNIPAPQGDKAVTGVGSVAWDRRRTPTGYVVEGKIDFEAHGFDAKRDIGFVAHVSDMDVTPNIFTQATWGRKQGMMYPHQPHFSYWDDARGCGRLVLEK